MGCRSVTSSDEYEPVWPKMGPERWTERHMAEVVRRWLEYARAPRESLLATDSDDEEFESLYYSDSESD